MLSSLCLRLDGIFSLFRENTENFLKEEVYIMPKTKFQNSIFTLMTAVLMAYCMIVYSVAINSLEGLINQSFLIALLDIIRKL